MAVYGFGLKQHQTTLANVLVKGMIRAQGRSQGAIIVDRSDGA
jgi:hypothetical protein